MGAVKGYFWRSSVEGTLRTALEQLWHPSDRERVMCIFPGGHRVLPENQVPDMSEIAVPRIVLTRDDQADFRNDEKSLSRITTRVCIDLMRQGFEVRPDIYTQGVPVKQRVEQGPVVRAKLIETFKQFVEEFGPLAKPDKNGGKKK